MPAIRGADLEVVLSACKEAAQGQVCSAANISSRTQVVIAGDTAAIDRAIVLLQERGAKRAIKLKVSAPFHCALMQPAQRRLALKLKGITFRNLATPIITNVDAKAVTTGDQASDALVRLSPQPYR